MDAMAVQMTEQQLNALIAALTGSGGGGGGAQASGAAAVVGPMQPSHLGKDKIKRYKRLEDWIQDAGIKMKFLKLTEDPEQIRFIRSCAGAELTDFLTKESRIRFEDIQADGARVVEAQTAHTFKQIKEESKKALLKLVSRDRAIIDLLRLEQGTRSFIDFLSEVEDQEHLSNVTKRESKSSHSSKHGDLNYSCNQCDYQVTRKKSLKFHIKSKHEGVNYSCNQCDFNVTRKEKTHWLHK